MPTFWMAGWVYDNPAVGEALPGSETEVASLQRTPGSAVRTLMAIFGRAR